ncbi:hypothetical protein BV20DRAFT_963065 [Pilatotrama ljubarskyi]|nr:hypothetical protein BV20DRAFT_963065 [Pilatotrama ljubarskyi]
MLRFRQAAPSCDSRSCTSFWCTTARRSQRRLAMQLLRLRLRHVLLVSPSLPLAWKSAPKNRSSSSTFDGGPASSFDTQH